METGAPERIENSKGKVWAVSTFAEKLRLVCSSKTPSLHFATPYAFVILKALPFPCCLLHYKSPKQKQKKLIFHLPSMTTINSK
jgi:hypothetical protein